MRSVEWDVAVVGAGPAGAVVARQLARLGRSVVLIDRSHFPRPKVCGACLNARALGALAEVGLGGPVAELGAVPLSEMRLGGWGRSARLALSGGVALSRFALDASLVKSAVSAGCHGIFGSVVRPDAVTAERVTLRLGRSEGVGGERLSARVLIDATGLSGGLTPDGEVASNSRVGAGTVCADDSGRYEPGTIHMAIGAEGYVGLVRQEDGLLNIAAALEPKSGPPADAVRRILRTAGFPLPEWYAESVWRGRPALTRRPRRVASHRVFRVGDAAGYVEPFTGEGMAWAIAGAAALAPIVDQALSRPWGPEFTRRWEVVHSDLVARRQRFCRVVASALRSPALARAAILLLGVSPGLARPFVRHLNRVTRPAPF